MEIITDTAELSEIITKIPIKIVPEEPHFFIKWVKDNKRYRISASFKYLNTNYKLHINIIRDFGKKELEPIRLKYLLSLIKQHQRIDLDVAEDSPKIYRYKDSDKKTEVFLVQREFDGEIGSTLVFFSLSYWSLADYLDSLTVKEI